jgi:hypothetical protein
MKLFSRIYSNIARHVLHRLSNDIELNQQLQTVQSTALRRQGSDGPTQVRLMPLSMRDARRCFTSGHSAAMIEYRAESRGV